MYDELNGKYRERRDMKIEFFSKGIAGLAQLFVFGLCLFVVRYPLGVGPPHFNWITLSLIVLTSLLVYWPVLNCTEKYAVMRWYP